MFAYLKRKKKLNTPNLRQLLVPVVEHLDFDSVYITEGILKTVCNNCPNLRVLILKDCGYVVTDSIVEMLLRVSASTGAYSQILSLVEILVKIALDTDKEH